MRRGSPADKELATGSEPQDEGAASGGDGSAVWTGAMPLTVQLEDGAASPLGGDPPVTPPPGRTPGGWADGSDFVGWRGEPAQDEEALAKLWTARPPPVSDGTAVWLLGVGGAATSFSLGLHAGRHTGKAAGVSIGRGPSCRVQLNDREVSATHARLWWEEAAGSAAGSTEAAAAGRGDEATTLFHACDKNSDGKVSKQELKTALKAHGSLFKQLGLHRLKDAHGFMARADANHDGSCDLQEFREFLSRLGYKARIEGAAARAAAAAADAAAAAAVCAARSRLVLADDPGSFNGTFLRLSREREPSAPYLLS